jgi:hypothetical protein
MDDTKSYKSQQEKTEFAVEVVEKDLLRKEKVIKSSPFKTGITGISKETAPDFEISMYRVFATINDTLISINAIPVYSFDKELLNKLFVAKTIYDNQPVVFNVIVKPFAEDKEKQLLIECKNAKDSKYELFLPGFQKEVLLAFFSKEVVEKIEQDGAVLTYLADIKE